MLEMVIGFVLNSPYGGMPVLALKPTFVVFMGCFLVWIFVVVVMVPPLNLYCVKNQEIYEELFRQFVFALNNLVLTGLNPVKVLSAYLALIREHLGLLRAKVLELSFSSVAEEIWFFKCLKPKYYAEKIYRFELYAIEMAKPVGTAEMIRLYLEDELKQVSRFFKQFAFYYQYYRTDSVELDHIGFVRGADGCLLLLPELPEADPLFSTMLDYLFAKFMAFERLQEYLLLGMGEPLPMVHAAPGSRMKRRTLRWTGDSINAVELGFALHDTGQLNDGHASLTEIFDWMAETLNIVVKKPHRRFDEIEGRKLISKTDFMDQLRNSILNRIDRKLAYDPEKEAQILLRSERKRKAAEKKAAGSDGVAK